MRELNEVKRIVIKVGSSTLTKEGNTLNRRYINKLVMDISNQIDKGYEIILVSSGAVAAGMSKLGIKQKPKTIKEKQGCASIGQAKLIYEYMNLFNVQEKECAQILLVSDDIYIRERALNLRNTFFNLIGRKVVPIVNENDSIAVNELCVGDNDTMSSLVAVLTESDMLIMLSDIEGVYDKNPMESEDAKLISSIEKIDYKIDKLCYSNNSLIGTGGMQTKISAARIATEKGIHTIIANGKKENVIEKILNGEEIGTHFIAKRNNLTLGDEYKINNYTGKIYLEKYNEEHIHLKDIVKTSGKFKKGEIVEILTNSCEKYYGYINVSNSNLTEDQGEDAIIYIENIKRGEFSE